MKLYVMPGACSMSCHIALEETHTSFEAVLCPTENRSRWEELEKLNPMGAVPVLVLDDGKVLTQNEAILNYIADKNPDSGLLPKVGTFERAQTLQWLSWVASDLHKSFVPLFMDNSTDEAEKEAAETVDRYLGIADKHLTGKTYLVGDKFSVADAYLFTVTGWAKMLKLPMDKHRHLNEYCGRIAERKAVQTVLKREGLLK